MKTALCLALLCSTAYARSTDELVAAGTPEQKAQAVLDEMGHRNAGWRDFTADVQMSLQDPSGGNAERSFTVKLLEKGDSGDQSLIVFSSPSDMKGTAVLSHASASGDDEQWLYLPSSHRVKRISSGNRNGSFVGSEFSFEDLTSADARKYRWQYTGQETCGTAKCLVLSAVPKDASSAYSRRVIVVDQELRVSRVELYDRKAQLQKTLTYADWQKVGRYDRARTWTMKNAQSGKATTLHFSTMKLDSKYVAADFGPDKLGN